MYSCVNKIIFNKKLQMNINKYNPTWLLVRRTSSCNIWRSLSFSGRPPVSAGNPRSLTRLIMRIIDSRSTLNENQKSIDIIIYRYRSMIHTSTRDCALSTTGAVSTAGNDLSAATLVVVASLLEIDGVEFFGYLREQINKLN